MIIFHLFLLHVLLPLRLHFFFRSLALLLAIPVVVPLLLLPVGLVLGLVVRDPHLHVEVDMRVLVIRRRFAILRVEQIDPAPLLTLLRAQNLLPHLADARAQRLDPLLGLGHRVLVALRVEQPAFELAILGQHLPDLLVEVLLLPLARGPGQLRLLVVLPHLEVVLLQADVAGPKVVVNDILIFGSVYLHVCPV